MARELSLLCVPAKVTELPWELCRAGSAPPAPQHRLGCQDVVLFPTRHPSQVLEPLGCFLKLSEQLWVNGWLVWPGEKPNLSTNTGLDRALLYKYHKV